MNRPDNYERCATREWREEGLWRPRYPAYGPANKRFWWCELCQGYIRHGAQRATAHIATKKHQANNVLLRLAK